MIEQKNYYAVIPANVRYDKDLTPNAKLLYGEITALSNEKGYCWATNEYFSKLYNVSNRSIQEWLNKLEKKGYISRQIIYKENLKEVQERRISIFITSRENIHEGSEENFMRGSEEIFADNNTYINNTSNNKNYNKKNFETFWNEYPKKQSKAKTEQWFIKNNPNDELFEIMLNKLKQFKKTKQWENMQYIPLATTWLNQKRWEDEIEEVEDSIQTKEDELAYMQQLIEERKAKGTW